MNSASVVPTGQVFGRWTVLASEKRSGKERFWLCRCSCGTEKYVARRSLVSGGSQSCGCLRNERVRKSLSYDLMGQSFGQLTVVGPAGHAAAEGIQWLCRCNCGKEISVTATLLVNGKKSHCGCRTALGKANDITGHRFGILTALEPLPQRDAKGSVLWRCVCDCGKEVCYSYNTLLYTSVKSCGCRKKEHEKNLGQFLTRIDGTSIDLLKSKKVHPNSSTGVRGVYRSWGRYGAKITFQKKTYYLGVYDTLDEAAEARKKAELQLTRPVVTFYEAWARQAEKDPDWARENPIRIRVTKQGKAFLLDLEPCLDQTAVR